jgi:NAD-dependent dihydropyrimidine dehydrogenase PreA subunit/flavodoxin
MDNAYDNVLIYYLSGTGNAMAAARWMTENAEKKGVSTQLIPIDRQKDPYIPQLEGKTLVGFCYPTHGFGIPWAMLKFIWRFPKIKQSKAFISNTRAGSKVSKVFLPGISGLAQWIPFLILLLKGYGIKGLLPLDMPSNWTSVHPGYKKKVVESIFMHCQAVVNRFMDRLLTGKRYYHPYVFIFLPFDLALAPIMVGYQMYGRFLFAKLFVATDKCNACGICVDKCPVRAIRMYGSKPYWTLHCESCMRCINICPEKAIQVSHLLATIIIIAMSVIPFYLLIIELFSKLPDKAFSTLDFFAEWGIKVFMFVLIYWFVYLLMKFRVFSIIVEYTSLTRYWRGYRAPGIFPKDFFRLGKKGK